LKEAIAPGYYVITVPNAPKNSQVEALVNDTIATARAALAHIDQRPPVSVKLSPSS
jgi:hypothetical protein